MKKYLYFSTICLLTLNLSAQNFTVKAIIPGIQKGCEVKLVSINGRQRELAKGVTDENGFVLSGQTDTPKVVKLRINDKPSYAEGELPKVRRVSFMLAEGTTTVSADNITCVPLDYEFGNTPLKMESNVKVTGGAIQQHYQEWRNYILNAELAAWYAGHVVWKAQFSSGKMNDNPAGMDEMKVAEQASQNVVDKLNSEFIKAHPDYAISLVLQQQALESLFAFTDEELDAILERMKGNEDTVGYQQLCSRIEDLRKYTKGTLYTDLALELPDGKQVKLSDYIQKGKVNFIDFWASWCGPCRMAIPSVKEMQRKIGDKVNILSISVDNSKEAWKKAMDEELMSWTQLLVPKTSTKAMMDAYRVRSIPYLMIVDSDGRILCTTHDADQAHAVIERMITE